MDSSSQRPTRLGAYVIAVNLLAVPFWLAGTSGRRLLGDSIPIDLPVSALAAFVPMLAAVILTWWDGGRAGALGLLASAVDVWKIRDRRWLLPAFLLMPALLALEYGWMLLAGRSLPDPIVRWTVLPQYFAMFFIGAIGEELGWQGYAVAALRGRCTALQTGLVVGLVWAVWHVVPFLETDHTADWVVWQCAQVVVARLLMVWLSNNAGGSIFIAVVFHTMINVGEFAFPDDGSHYDPFLNTLLMAIVTGVVVLLWGPGSLSRFCLTRSCR
jgi:uncharacterized protein